MADRFAIEQCSICRVFLRVFIVIQIVEVVCHVRRDVPVDLIYAAIIVELVELEFRADFLDLPVNLPLLFDVREEVGVIRDAYDIRPCIVFEKTVVRPRVKRGTEVVARTAVAIV